MMKPPSAMIGSWITITIVRPISDIRSRPMAVMRRLMTWLTAAAPVVSRADELGRMAVGEKGDVLVQQLVEQPSLIIGDDAVADRQQQDRGTVGGKALGREDHHGDQADDDDAMKIVTDIGLVGHGAEQIGGQRRGGGGNAHQHKGNDVLRPVLERFVEQQTADQRDSLIIVQESAVRLSCCPRSACLCRLEQCPPTARPAPRYRSQFDEEQRGPFGSEPLHSSSGRSIVAKLSEIECHRSCRLFRCQLSRRHSSRSRHQPARGQDIRAQVGDQGQRSRLKDAASAHREGQQLGDSGQRHSPAQASAGLPGHAGYGKSIA